MVDISPVASYTPNNSTLQVKNASNHTSSWQGSTSLSNTTKNASRNFTDNTVETRDQTHQQMTPAERAALWNEISPHLTHWQNNLISDLNHVQARADDVWTRAFQHLLPNLQAEVAAQINEARGQACEKLCQQYNAMVRTAGSSRNSWVQESWQRTMITFERHVAELAAKFATANIQHVTSAISDAYKIKSNAYAENEARAHQNISQDLAIFKGALDTINYTVNRDQTHNETITENVLTITGSFVVNESASDTTDNAGAYAGDVGTIAGKTGSGF